MIGEFAYSPLFICAVVALLCSTGTALIAYVLGERAGIRDTERRWSDACKRKDDWDGHPSVDERIASAMHETTITDIVSRYILESYRLETVQTWFVCSICTCACNVPAGISYKDLRAAIDWHIRHDCPGADIHATVWKGLQDNGALRNLQPTGLQNRCSAFESRAPCHNNSEGDE